MFEYFAVKKNINTKIYLKSAHLKNIEVNKILKDKYL